MLGRAAVLLLVAVAGHSATPDAKALLNQSRDALNSYKSYVVEQHLTVDAKGTMTTHIDMPVKLAASKPGKLRIESNGQLGATLIVSDGENTWMYLSAFKQYTKTPAASSPEALLKSITPGIGQMMEQFKTKDPYRSAKIIAEEPVQVAGKRIECYVVEATMDTINLPGSMKLSGSVQKLWIDKTTKLTVKMTSSATVEGGPMPGPIEVTQSIEMTSFQLNQPVPDSVFTFTPPEGAKEVAEFKGPVKATPDLAGKDAVGFKLKSIDGTEYSLEALRGKVVLLDFWATWCAPCRRDFPMLEKISQEFHDKGLVMLGMNAGEDLDTVKKFLVTTKLNYPIVLTEGTEVENDYRVTAFPTTVVIDRDGKIALYHVGSGGEKELRESLAKLGLAPASQAPGQ